MASSTAAPAGKPATVTTAAVVPPEFPPFAVAPPGAPVPPELLEPPALLVPPAFFAPPAALLDPPALVVEPPECDPPAAVPPLLPPCELAELPPCPLRLAGGDDCAHATKVIAAERDSSECH
jgi:hypothetical protein